jgi:sugar/nucleoside kinase (ribokinase family)
MSVVVVVGDLMVDVVASVDERLARASDTAARVRWTGGGAGANVAAGLAAAGVDVVLVARVGDDLVGRAAVAELRAGGVEVRGAVDPGAPTGTCVVVVDAGGERTMLPDRGANLALSPEDLPAELFVAGAHLHLSGYVLLDERCRPAGLRALHLARGAGMTISVDPASAAPLRRAGEFLDWVAGVDVLMPNADEAAVLTGEADPRACAEALAHRFGEVVVTLGADGALWTDGQRLVHAPAPAAEVVDTTGAGDAFAAAWLAARRGGDEPEGALARGCAAGSAAVARAGARP